jgi:SOS response regulatory protein OraA/RecX
VAGPPTSEALEDALRALRRRDFSVRELEARLEARGFDVTARKSALETLLRTGLLDDRRFAEARAAALARRGAGDALIRHALAAAGVAPEVVEEALDVLEPEAERARSLVERRGAGAKTARFLSGKGFSDEVVGAVASGPSEELG